MSNLIRRAILALTLIAGIAPAIAQVPPPVPALPDTERRTSYSISASLCTCAVGFQLFGDSTDVTNWIEVFVNGARQSGNWTITSPTGSLATIPRPITDAVLTFTVAQTGTVQIVGARRPRRTSQFQESQPVPTRNYNQALSDIIAMLRENWDKTNDVTGRAVLAPPGDTLNLLPILANRQNLGACFDSGGNLTSCVSIPGSAFAAGNGIAFTGTNPTTIANNIQAGNGISITGTNPEVIANNIQAGNGISITGTNPEVIANNIQAGNGISITGTNPMIVATTKTLIELTGFSYYLGCSNVITCWVGFNPSVFTNILNTGSNPKPVVVLDQLSELNISTGAFTPQVSGIYETRLLMEGTSATAQALLSCGWSTVPSGTAPTQGIVMIELQGSSQYNNSHMTPLIYPLTGGTTYYMICWSSAVWNFNNLTIQAPIAPSPIIDFVIQRVIP